MAIMFANLFPELYRLNCWTTQKALGN